MKNTISDKVLIIVTFAISIGTSIFVFSALTGNALEITFPGNQIFGEISLRIDALSAWMILIINFTFITGVLYSNGYLKQYQDKKKNLILHRLLIVVLHISMILVCSFQNLIAFIVVWEIESGAAFLLVIFEYWNKETIKAGLNYFIQSHVGVLFIAFSFIWVIVQTGSTDFKAIQIFTEQVPEAVGVTLFILLFIGFSFKAGFVPFHTWLPYAHPAAPSHISGIMSGVIIKLGIYGILRTMLLIKSDYLVMGEIILSVSIVSGLYGVMLAIVQHNLKKLLAYHSVENIGIIGIGIGIGAIGLGLKNDLLAIVGFAGGMLHILNHSLFKSILFYSAGSVYQQTHTLNIENLGGLIKRMPKTSGLFLLASLAICGLPPFNGFISEFLIYSGLFSSLKSESFSFSLLMLTAIVSLVIIGGLAILCFTKAFGVVFLGTERQHYHAEPGEVSFQMLLPKYLAASLIVSIGIFPGFFLSLLKRPVALFVPGIKSTAESYFAYQSAILSNIGLIGFFLIAFIFIVYSIKRYFEKNSVFLHNSLESSHTDRLQSFGKLEHPGSVSKKISFSPTWGCGYTAPNPKMQYTASSFVKTYSNLIEPVLSLHKNDAAIEEIFPGKKEYASHTYDKLEFYLIDKNLKWLKKMLLKLNFLQNGKIQFYILYGVVFILLIILISYGEYFWNAVYNFLKMF